MRPFISLAIPLKRNEIMWWFDNAPVSAACTHLMRSKKVLLQNFIGPLLFRGDKFGGSIAANENNVNGKVDECEAFKRLSHIKQLKFAIQ